MSETAERSLLELSEELTLEAAHLSAGMCRYLELVAECDRRGGWSGWTSCTAWLAWRVGLNLRSAREHVRVAGALTGLPLIQAAFARGELSYAKVRALTRVQEPADEAELLELAQLLSASQLERALRSYQRVTSDEARELQQREGLSWFWDDDGSLVAQARFAPEDGALFLKALAAAREQLWNKDKAEKDTGSAGPPLLPRRPSNLDALVSVADAALAQQAGGRTGPERYQVVIHVDQQALSAGAAGSCALADGPALAPETARRLACDASLVTLIEHAGEPLGVGRKTRTIPLALRRALQARDGCCRFPGCSNRHLDAHHITHWADQGETELGNLVSLCRRHHRLVHEGGWSVDHALHFHDPCGNRVPDAPPQPPGSLSALHENNEQLGISAQSYRSGSGEPMDLGLTVDALLHAVGQPTPRSSIANQAAEALTAQLAGRSYGRHRIEGILWYGAVDINPKHLIVRVLLDGSTYEQLPPNPAWLGQLQQQVRDAFEQQGWPALDTITCQLDSIDRAHQRGWTYLSCRPPGSAKLAHCGRRPTFASSF